ncbi:DUF5937 family protein [Streptomyces sp. NPDC001939]
MSVVLVLEGATPAHFVVGVSPLAELAAALHVLTERSHHPEHRALAERVVGAAGDDFRVGLERFSPLWAALRWRGFYLAADGARRTLPEQLRALAELPADRFTELTAYACASGYRGFDFARLRQEPAQADALRHAVSGLPAAHRALAADLMSDPEGVRAELLVFLGLCRSAFFADLWAETEPALAAAAHRMRQRLADEGPASALASLSPSSTRLADPPRVVFDKLHHSVITPARTQVLLIPTRYGAPHLIVKNEPGLPPVLHFPVDAPEVGVTLARSRMLALTDPRRVRLCRLIARQPLTTADLADRLSMTRPQVSRHLRALRDLGLVRTERDGRFVHYGLDLDAVERIGRDVATALQY